MKEGTPITIELNEAGNVIQIQIGMMFGPARTTPYAI